MSDVPDLLTIRELQAVFRRNYRATLRRVVTHLVPLGGVVKIGGSYYVHRWALDEYLARMTVTPKPPTPRRPIWDDPRYQDTTPRKEEP